MARLVIELAIRWAGMILLACLLSIPLFGEQGRFIQFYVIGFFGVVAVLWMWSQGSYRVYATLPLGAKDLATLVWIQGVAFFPLLCACIQSWKPSLNGTSTPSSLIWGTLLSMAIPAYVFLALHFICSIIQRLPSIAGAIMGLCLILPVFIAEQITDILKSPQGVSSFIILTLAATVIASWVARERALDWVWKPKTPIPPRSSPVASADSVRMPRSGAGTILFGRPLAMLVLICLGVTLLIFLIDAVLEKDLPLMSRVFGFQCAFSLVVPTLQWAANMRLWRTLPLSTSSLTGVLLLHRVLVFLCLAIPLSIALATSPEPQSVLKLVLPAYPLGLGLLIFASSLALAFRTRFLPGAPIFTGLWLLFFFYFVFPAVVFGVVYMMPNPLLCALLVFPGLIYGGTRWIHHEISNNSDVYRVVRKARPQ